ncbi:MAG: hypothetical protein ACI8RZ_002047 [Myxococcota bacterium]|jgi:hypothetical protein
MITLPLLLLACSQPDPVETLLECTDADCRSSAIEAAYTADAEQITAWMTDLDPVIQASLLDHLTHAFPGDARALCKDVPRDKETRSRCTRRNVRPHLFANPGGQKKPPPRNPNAAPGPRSSNLPVPPSAAALWADTVLPPLDCGTRPTDLCAADAAMAAAESGEGAATIGARCQAGNPDDERSYGECLFKAAEVVAGRGAAGVEDALALCSDSVFGPMCVAHTLTRVSPAVPNADAFTPADIVTAREAAEALSSATDGALYVDFFWATWTHSSFVKITTVHGALLDHLPVEAHHHVSTAVAYRLMSQESPADFATAVERTAAALSSRTGTSPRRTRAATTRLKKQHWERDWAGEERFPTTWMLGPSRRVLAEEPEVDLQIAVLEAAGQLTQPPPADFFLSVLDDPSLDRRVRWTAARIGGSIDTEAASKRTDADTVIQARLSKSPAKSKAKVPR